MTNNPENNIPPTHSSSYSESELQHIYSLARLYLESGYHRRAEVILSGLIRVAPDFYQSLLGLAYLAMTSENYDLALEYARNAVRLSNGKSPEAILSIVIASLNKGNLATAGSYLGELKDLQEEGIVLNSKIQRCMELQLKRYEDMFGSRTALIEQS